MNWIFDSFQLKAEGLGLYRIFCALFILFFALPSRGMYTFLSGLPADFFSPPPGPMMFFNGFPPEYIFLICHYFLITALILLCLGCATKTTSICTGFLLLIIKGFIYSLGKIDHDILLTVVPFVMAFSGWGEAYSLDTLRRDNSSNLGGTWALSLLALIIGFMMFTAGFPKILGGWLHINSHAAEGHYFKQLIVRNRHDLLAPYARHISNFGWELLDYATVLFEIGFLVAIIHPKSTRLFISLAVFFHFGTMLILNISFLPNFLAYAAFLNWDTINETIKNGASNFTLPSKIIKYVSPITVGVGMIAILLLSLLLSHYNLLESDLTMGGVLFVCFSVPIAAVYLFKVSYSALKS